MLEPAAQTRFAERMGYASTVDNTKLEGKIAEQLALPTSGFTMHPPDYEITGKLQGATSEWWKKEHAEGLMAERRQLGAAASLLSPALLVMCCMLVAPLLLVLRFSVNRYDPSELMIETATAANYARFVTDPFYLGVLRTTLFVAASSTALCLLLGPADRVSAGPDAQPVEVRSACWRW